MSFWRGSAEELVLRHEANSSRAEKSNEFAGFSLMSLTLENAYLFCDPL